MSISFPVIDVRATGHNIRQLRKERNVSVKQMQTYFGFADPQAIYKWQSGKSLPSVDNLYALSVLLGVPMDYIIVPVMRSWQGEQQDDSCCSPYFRFVLAIYDGDKSLTVAIFTRRESRIVLID